MSNKNYIKRLTYTRYIYGQGTELLANRTSISDAMAILSFHDALEQFLLVIAVKLRIRYQESIMQYWDEANKKQIILPNKNDISNLCKVRGLFKHRGILPNAEECNNIRHRLHDFFIEVSQKILGIDFLKLSLSGLIEYDDVKEYIKNAEELLNQNNYEESIVESAKAFKLLEKKKEGDIWYSFVVSQYPFSSLNELVNYGKIEDKLLLESLREVRDRLNDIIPNLNFLLLGIDTYKYQKFKLMTPIINLTLGEEFYVHKGGSPFKHIINYNEENALFCLNFIIDTALRFQSEPFDLINRNKPQTIRIKNSQTKVYTYKEGAFKEVGTIDKDKIFNNAILTLVIEKGKDYWRIIYEGNEGYIEFNNADFVRKA